MLTEGRVNGRTFKGLRNAVVVNLAGTVRLRMPGGGRAGVGSVNLALGPKSTRLRSVP